MSLKVNLVLSVSAVEAFGYSPYVSHIGWKRWFKAPDKYKDYRPSELRESGQIVDRQDLDRRKYQTAVSLDEQDLRNLLTTWAMLDIWSDNHVFTYTRKKRTGRPTKVSLVREIRQMSDWWDEDCKAHAEQYAAEYLATIPVEKESTPNYSRMASFLLEAIASEYIRVEGEELFDDE